MNKRFFAWALGTMCSMAVFAPSVAFAQTGEFITSFDVRASLTSDRQLIVTEQIAYDFGKNQKHGIFRDIPVRYERNGASYNLRLKVQSVLMDNQSAPYDVQQRGDNVRIKIGDADELVTGKHTYAITYQTDRAINFFDGEAELYWNVTGNDWEVPIGSTSFLLTGPDGFSAQDARTTCFTGAFGSTASSCTVSGTDVRVTAKTTAPLAPGEGLTVAVRFSPGLIAEPTLAERVWGFVFDN